ncbi:MAG TPA: RNA methyltransferase [Haloplasmataceae bacterium]
MITSINNDKVKYYTKLMNNKKLRDNDRVFIVEGEHLVSEAINSGVVIELLISDKKYEKYEVYEHQYVTVDIIRKICDTMTPQGIIALCKQQEVKSFTRYNRLLLLDNIQDPGNLGTLIRSCDAFNFDGMVLNLQTVDVYNPKVVRATQGAIFRVPVIRQDLKSYISYLRSKDVKIFGTALVGESLSKIKPSENMAFILGNEGNGIDKEILKMTDINIYIEMNGRSESLNVGVAGSIIMYNFRK